MLKRNLKDVS